MQYKKLQDGSLKSLAYCRTKCDFFNFLSCIYEVTLYDKWVPFCTNSSEFKQLGDFGKGFVAEYHFGKFLFSREMCVAGFGWDRMFHRGCVTVECKSLNKVL